MRAMRIVYCGLLLALAGGCVNPADTMSRVPPGVPRESLRKLYYADAEYSGQVGGDGFLKQGYGEITSHMFPTMIWRYKGTFENDEFKEGQLFRNFYNNEPQVQVYETGFFAGGGGYAGNRIANGHFALTPTLESAKLTGKGTREIYCAQGKDFWDVTVFEGTFVDGRLQGPGQITKKQSSRQSKVEVVRSCERGEFVNDLREGVWTSYDRDGVSPLGRGTYRANERVGLPERLGPGGSAVKRIDLKDPSQW